MYQNNIRDRDRQISREIPKLLLPIKKYHETQARNTILLRKALCYKQGFKTKIMRRSMVIGN
jgi:hypothetical protein